MTNRTFIIAAIAFTVSASSAQAAGRWLPKGEDTPGVIERVFESPQGEVQFIQRGVNREAMLRTSTGNLLTMDEIRGARECDGWHVDKDGATVPAGCEFLFYNQAEGVYVSVRSEEMTESSLFHSVRTGLRERGKNVAL